MRKHPNEDWFANRENLPQPTGEHLSIGVPFSFSIFLLILLIPILGWGAAVIAPAIGVIFGEIARATDGSSSTT